MSTRPNPPPRAFPQRDYIPAQGVNPPARGGVATVPPITQQPLAYRPDYWMTKPQPSTNCPPGLEYLILLDRIFIHQQLELLEIVTGCETQNRYLIKNGYLDNIYFALEISDFLSRQVCGNIRPFEMTLSDCDGNPAIYLNRTLACGDCCCPCCLQYMEVGLPRQRGRPLTLLGIVEQEWTVVYPYFSIKNANGDVVLRIEGPFCTSICTDIHFKIVSVDGRTVGGLTRVWAGCVQQTFTDADNFEISFPMELDVPTKATLIGACLLIDFMYFENSQKANGLGGC